MAYEIKLANQRKNGLFGKGVCIGYTPEGIGYVQEALWVNACLLYDGVCVKACKIGDCSWALTIWRLTTKPRSAKVWTITLTLRQAGWSSGEKIIQVMKVSNVVVTHGTLRGRSVIMQHCQRAVQTKGQEKIHIVLLHMVPTGHYASCVELRSCQSSRHINVCLKVSVWSTLELSTPKPHGVMRKTASTNKE